MGLRYWNMPFEEISETWTARPCRLKTIDFFETLEDKPFTFLYGDGPQTRWLMLGEDPFLVLNEPKGPLPGFRRSGDLPPVFPDFMGYVGYEYGCRHNPFLPPPAPKPFPFPDCHLAVYRSIRLYDRETETLYQGQRQGGERSGPMRNGLLEGGFRARKIWDSDSAKGYQEKVERIRQEILKGNVYQVNLSRQERWAFRGDLRLFARRLYEANPAPFSAFIAGPDFSVISSSPERFFRIADGRILASPIKGTAPRGDNPLADAHGKRDLMSSPKDRSELAMITDLMRNDLTRVCQIPSVSVENFPRLESYPNVHHLVADVSGELVPGLGLEALFAALFPGGSITGCPKITAMRLIRELEATPRMVYTGALGWCSHDLLQADFNIAIRTAWASASDLLFGVGGGVVWDSDPKSEYLETVHKGSSIVRCLTS
ncbi:MAG: anthranilate synthase component I family protein [Holophaga sp.]|nr:anthranilate synthase component I family protein [Holophaga sp.]